MNDTCARSIANGEAYHAGDVIEMSLDETLSAVEWVYPNNHVLFVYLIGKIKEVPSSLTGLGLMNLLHLGKILPVSVLVNIVIHEQHFLGDEFLVNLVGHDVGLAGVDLAHLILLSNNGCSGIKLPQVVLDGVLDVNVGICEHIIFDVSF